MNNQEHRPTVADEDDPEPQGPNLFVLYALLALALLAAMGFAWLIVLPFYRHR